MPINNCPACKSNIVWFSSEPRQAKYTCQQCNLIYPVPMVQQPFEFGVLRGDWDDLEVAKIVNYLKTAGLKTDWHFFKGRYIWCAYRDSPDWAARDIISTIILDDLVYWVLMADQNPLWHEVYARFHSKFPITGQS